MKESRVLWMGDKDQILTTGFSAVSVCFFYVLDKVTYFQTNEVTNGFFYSTLISLCEIFVYQCTTKQ